MAFRVLRGEVVVKTPRVSLAEKVAHLDTITMTLRRLVFPCFKDLSRGLCLNCKLCVCNSMNFWEKLYTTDRNGKGEICVVLSVVRDQLACHESDICIELKG